MQQILCQVSLMSLLLASSCLGSPLLPHLAQLTPLVTLLQDPAMDMADMEGAMDAAAGGAMGAADMTAMGKNSTVIKASLGV